jgi:NADPH:quinone reductase
VLRQMRAFVLESFESEPRLRTDVDAPEPGSGEVLIRVHASSVNPTDVHAAAGRLREWGMEYRFPVTLGHDLAGVVERVGSNVSRFAVGDEVFGFINTEPILHVGSYADYVIVPEVRFIAAKPASVDFVRAATVPLAASTAWFAIDALALSEGDRVLIVGASGGVGSFAVQLAATRGAYVIATGLEADRSYLRDLGASDVLPRELDVVGAVREGYPDGVEALFDVTRPQPADFAALAGVVRVGGRAASALGAADGVPAHVSGINVVNRADAVVLEDLARRVDAGELRAPVQRSYDITELSVAFQHLQTEHTQGKIAIAFG